MLQQVYLVICIAYCSKILSCSNISHLTLLICYTNGVTVFPFLRLSVCQFFSGTKGRHWCKIEGHSEGQRRSNTHTPGKHNRNAYTYCHLVPRRQTYWENSSDISRHWRQSNLTDREERHWSQLRQIQSGGWKQCWKWLWCIWSPSDR